LPEDNDKSLSMHVILWTEP